MSDEEAPEGESAWTMLTRRAVQDPDFRERLRSDPRAVVADYAGIDVPEDVEIIVVEDTPRTVHLVLPSAGLSLDDLDASGGVPGLLCGPWGLSGTCHNAPLC